MARKMRTTKRARRALARAASLRGKNTVATDITEAQAKQEQEVAKVVKLPKVAMVHLERMGIHCPVTMAQMMTNPQVTMAQMVTNPQVTSLSAR